MHGTTALGHPLHPALTDVPVGAWTVGVLADWLFVATGRVPAVAGDLALAIGVAGGLGAAVTRDTDLPRTDPHQGRTAMGPGATMKFLVGGGDRSPGGGIWGSGSGPVGVRAV